MFCAARMRVGRSLTVLLSMALLLGGCAGMGRPTPTPEPVTIRFAYRQGAMPAIAELVQAFQTQYPWISVAAQEVLRSGNQLSPLVRDGEVDAFRESRQGLAYVSENLLRPLNNVLADDWASVRDDYYQGTWEALNVAGEQWGIPAGEQVLVVNLNGQALASLGLKRPAPDWTLFDFVSLASSMNYPEGRPDDPASRLIGYCTVPTSIDPVVFVYLSGGRIVDDLNSPTQATLDETATVEAARWYADLFTTYNAAAPVALLDEWHDRGQYQALRDGQCGMWLGWFGEQAYYFGQDPEHNWSVLPLPKGQGGYELVDIDGYFVASSCEHPTEVMLWLRFLADRFEAAGGKVPPRLSLVNSEEYAAAVGAEVGAMARSFSSRMMIMPYGENETLTGVAELFTAAVTRIVMDGVDASQALAEAQIESARLFGQ
jgi:ABC-type glycerol-3-phosphate transport system substrate-binding protein